MANLYVHVVFIDQSRIYNLVVIARYYDISISKCFSSFLTYLSYLLHGSTITFSQIVNIMCPFYVAQYLEELDFLHELCLAALFSNRFVKFAAVLDNHGKLILAEYRKGIQSYWRIDFKSDNNYHHDACYLFHSDYVVPAIKKRRVYWPESTEEEQQEIHFEIIEIDDNSRLAVASITERRDKYLCIYLESSAPSQEIISKLRNAII